MENLVNELINTLDQENRVYDDILKISKNKTNIIVSGKVTELENTVKLEQSLVLQVGRLEGIREGIIDKLSKHLNIDSSRLTVSEIVKHLNKDQTQKLKASQDRIWGTIGELKTINELNSKLIKNSLDYINFSLNLFASIGPDNNNYGRNAQIGEVKKRNLFDMKL